MGTKALFGFLINGKYLVTYVGYDGDPPALGQLLLNELRQALVSDADLETWRLAALSLNEVDGSRNPSEGEIVQYRRFAREYNLSHLDREPSRRSLVINWYVLLESVRDSFTNLLEGGVIENDLNSNGEPNYQEFNYVLDFDARSFVCSNYSDTFVRFSLNDLPATLEWLFITDVNV